MSERRGSIGAAILLVVSLGLLGAQAVTGSATAAPAKAQAVRS
jgi:hypothetical protein